MFTKKTNFKPMKADAVVSAYKRNVLILWVLHALTVVAFFVVAAFLVMQKITLFNAFLSVMFLCVLNYLFYTGRRIQLHLLTNILNVNCDPVKFEKVFRKLSEARVNRGVCQLNIARGQYYAGKFEEALATLDAMARPKDNSMQIFLYYNVKAGCCEELGNFDRVVEIREKVKQIMPNLKDGSPALRNGQQLLTIIDGMLTFHRGSYMRAYEIYEDLFEMTSYPLSRLTVLIKLAKMDQVTGAIRSAADHCEYVLDSGGTTFYKKQAEEILALCRPRKKAEEPAAEQTGEDKEDADGAE